MSEKVKKAFKMPHPYVIVVILLIIVSILTYIVPAGEFDRYKADNGKSIVDATTYHSVEQTPVAIYEIPTYVVDGMIGKAKIIFPVILIGAALQVVLSTGMFHAYCNSVARKFAGRERLFIPVILMIFAIIGITQAANKFIGFAPLGVMLAAMLGYDAIVGVGMILLGITIGFSTGILGPTTAVAQEFAGLAAYSGISFRIISFFVFWAVTSWFLVKYAERTKKDPTKSYLHGAEGLITFDDDANDYVIEKRHPIVLAVVLISFAVLLYGAFKFKWGLTEIAVCFIWMGVISGFAYGYNASKIAKLFVVGAKGMSQAGLIIGLAGTVPLILGAGKILDTVALFFANGLNLFPVILKAPMMFIVNIILNFFVTSGTGQAAVVMPIMVPIADMANVTRQTAVLAFKFGDGFCNALLPHSAATAGFLAAVGISYDRWFKFISKLFGIWILVGSIILIVAQLTNYS